MARTGVKRPSFWIRCCDEAIYWGPGLLIILPVLAVDLLRLTRRFAAPVSRLREEMRLLGGGALGRFLPLLIAPLSLAVVLRSDQPIDRLNAGFGDIAGAGEHLEQVREDLLDNVHSLLQQETAGERAGSLAEALGLPQRQFQPERLEPVWAM